jgi:hypothetical protein
MDTVLIRYQDPGLQDSLKISVGKFWIKMHYKFLCEPLLRPVLHLDASLTIGAYAAPGCVNTTGS